MAWFTVAGRRAAVGPVGEMVAQLRRRGLHESATGHATEPGVVLAAGDATDTEEAIRAVASGGRVLVALAAGARCDPWQLLECGADDVVHAAGIEQLLVRLERWAAVDAVVESEAVRGVALGSAHSWRSVLREVVETARFTTSSMLLTGETGTGKEVVARLVHDLDARPDRGELVLLDCTTIVPSLSGSEFFGHTKGAFTGASATRSGAFEMADDGTLFLDEVGELPADLQAALLRVVQEGTYKPVGGTRWQRTSFRLLAATNRDLRIECDAGRFRRDLYYRLAAVTVRLPPLRERRADVVPLFRHFLGQARPRRRPLALDPAVVALLEQRDYPGNVRDLRQLAVRVAARHVGDGPVSPGDIPPDDRPDRSAPAGCPGPPAPAATSEPDPWDEQLERAVRLSLRSGVGLKRLRTLVSDIATGVAMDEAGSSAAAARMLGISRRALDYRTANGAAPAQAARASAASSS